MTTLTLTPAERIEVCGGYERPSYQRRKLGELGIPFTIDRLGYPVVLRADVERPPRSDKPRGDSDAAAPRLAGPGFSRAAG